jgi:hypothetical protein
VTGISRTKISYRVVRGVVHVSGQGFKPGGEVRLSYHERSIEVSRARPDGTVSWSFRLPANTHPRFRILASGEGGRAAYATGLSTPTLAFVATGDVVRLTGKNFSASSRVSLILHGRLVGVARTDATGSFHDRLNLPSRTTPSDSLTATDPVGRAATVRGLVSR